MQSEPFNVPVLYICIRVGLVRSVVQRNSLWKGLVSAGRFYVEAHRPLSTLQSSTSLKCNRKTCLCSYYCFNQSNNNKTNYKIIYWRIFQFNITVGFCNCIAAIFLVLLKKQEERTKWKGHLYDYFDAVYNVHVYTWKRLEYRGSLYSIMAAAKNQMRVNLRRYFQECSV